MATLITGGTGFIGLALAERLLSDGQDVVLFGVEPPDLNTPSMASLSGATIVLGDIRNPDDVDRALAAGMIENVVHMAAITPGPDRELRQAGLIADVNLGGTINLIDRIAETTNLRRLVVLSSVAVYGLSKAALSNLYEEELSLPSPASLYGITKLAAEQSALRLGSLHDLDVRVVRLGPVFGPWEIPTGARDTLSPHHQALSAALAGEEIILNRSMPADWIYSRDAALGLAKIIGTDRLRHQIYNLGGGAITDLTQWCALLAKMVDGVRWSVTDQGASGTIAYHLPKDRPALSVARLTRDVGYHPRYDLEAAAVDYLRWARVAYSDER